MKPGFWLGSEATHAFEQLLADGVMTGTGGVDGHGSESQLLVAAQRDPSEVVIDTIPCDDPEDAHEVKGVL